MNDDGDNNDRDDNADHDNDDGDNDSDDDANDLMMERFEAARSAAEESSIYICIVFDEEIDFQVEYEQFRHQRSKIWKNIFVTPSCLIQF